MSTKKTLKITKDQVSARWFVCRITSGRKSAKYGVLFSYPLFISLVAFGVFQANHFILFIAAAVAIFGVILPMHPFDYIYNYGVARVIGTERIPGRGSELQMSSSAAFAFILFAIVSIIFEMQLNYTIMAFIYVLSSVFFILIQLFTDNFSIKSIYNLFFKRGK